VLYLIIKSPLRGQEGQEVAREAELPPAQEKLSV